MMNNEAKQKRNRSSAKRRRAKAKRSASFELKAATLKDLDLLVDLSYAMLDRIDLAKNVDRTPEFSRAYLALTQISIISEDAYDFIKAYKSNK